MKNGIEKIEKIEKIKKIILINCIEEIVLEKLYWKNFLKKFFEKIFYNS